MTPADVVALVAESSLAASAGIATAWLARRPLRASFGAGAAYAGWLVVPCSIVAVQVPSRVVEIAPVATAVARRVEAVGAATASSPDAMATLVVVWLAGALAMAGWLAWQQRMFVARLGTLRLRTDGLFQATSVAGLPAALGLLRPRMVVPADFDVRYTHEQQALLAEHERTHVARGDLWANALVALLRCLSWFNPLVHAAASRFRHDQELACDQRVLATRPAARRAYGEAMFATQLAAQPLPLGCHWGFGHPLKERIEMLHRPLPAQGRRRTGLALAIVAAGTVSFAAWATQPPRAAGASAPAIGSPVPASAGGTASPGRAAPAGTPKDVVAPRPGMPADEGAQPALTPPAYPKQAVEQKLSGRVELLVDIDAEGHPTDIVVERANPPGVFEEQAIKAAWDWRFTPAIENGRAVPSRVRVPVDFKIDPPRQDGTVAGQT